MKNKRFTILTATLEAAINYATSVELDIPINYTYSVQTGGTANKQLLYPKEIQVINDCGSELEWIIISNSEEYAEYQKDQTNFDFVRLPESNVLQDNLGSVQKIYKFIIRKGTFGTVGTVTSDLCLDFMSYRVSN